MGIKVKQFKEKVEGGFLANRDTLNRDLKLYFDNLYNDFSKMFDKHSTSLEDNEEVIIKVTCTTRVIRDED
ncbi:MULTISPECIES: hypothetical protein [Pasteurellaceae]|uniref:Uncharacterized protein n=1 Tax=Pasteurella atlantica TaxID=2827233 RepID=A0AAW8CII0_9PAST|nr:MULTISPECIES: hypothetical protein [Pasteurella]MBR0573379.1 hypothetical protein [Pasteurella atlantica]MDP8039813.1 hypothetical protein [Pasteurella atlantica]MDP8041830.1 hypothetical protein [Pasteurella atlantica]MDP8043897.1 hypothetical protein [Pasteurella atlantica]MDP8046100.1 hypothetical protein [Pasteurella atlantica]